jgi:hypothetical protein
MSKRRKPEKYPGVKPFYINAGVQELDNDLLIGKPMPPLVEYPNPLHHPERIARLRAELAEFDAANDTVAKLEAENAQLRAELAALKVTLPPTQDPST